MLSWTVSGILLLTFWFNSWNQKHADLHNFCPNTSPSSCNLIVNAGPDTSLCSPGGFITLDGSVTGNPTGIEWTPHIGLSNPFILHPSADVTGPITYTLTALASDPTNMNLVYNGDFEQGNIGFYTEQNYVADVPILQNEMYPQGTYTVIDNPNLVNDGWPSCPDHTPGTGVNMMLINGTQSIDTIWCQTISVLPNNYYLFDAWVCPVIPTGAPIFNITMNDDIYINYLTGSYVCTWQDFYPTVWFSAAATEVEICLHNVTGFPGNDYALDDISFYQLCPVQDSVTITLFDDVAPEPMIDGPLLSCQGGIGVYTASFPPGTVIQSYVWSQPIGGTIISGQGTNQITIHWNVIGETNVCLSIETLCHSNFGCFPVTIGQEPSFAEISNPGLLCPGQIVMLSVPENDTVDQYQWIVPAGIDLLNGQGTNVIEIQWGMIDEAEVCVNMTDECGTTSSCLTLSMFSGYETFFDTTICQGTTILINGNEYGNGVLFGTELFTSLQGCDSTVEIVITELSGVELMVTEMLCMGDSVFLQGAFQTQTGIYVDTLTTIYGCDSIRITDLIVSAFDTTLINSTTCDPALAGINITTFHLGNCDSTVVNQVFLLPSDTTLVFLFSCSLSDTGQTLQLLPNHDGCDSMVITNTFLLLSDTTFLFHTSCDSSEIGIMIQQLSNVAGCDSLVIQMISFSLADTTILYSGTCIYADTGTITSLLINIEGCDSLVISHTIYAGIDSMYISSSSCNPADTGNFIVNFTNQFGCDSVLTMRVSLLPSTESFIFSTTCDSSLAGSFNYNFNNQFGCDSIVHETVSLVASSEIFLSSTTCHPSDTGTFIAHYQNQNGCDSIVRLTVIFQAADTTDIFYKTCDPQLVGSLTNTFFNQYGCDSIVIEITELYDLPFLGVEITTDYNSYGVSCFGKSDGSAKATVIGSGPFQFLWSTGSKDQTVVNLGAGNYNVNITDGNGCQTSSSVIITEPPPMQYNFSYEDILCFGEQNGQAILSGIQGGVSPWMTSIDGNSFQTNLSYINLNAGDHDLVITDQNGCSSEEQFALTEPEYWSVKLGPDTLIAYGNSIDLSANIQGQPYGSLQFAWSDGQCDNCQSRTIDVVSGKIYIITATDENGCTSIDSIRLDVFTNRDIFIPNIFSPNGDGINDRFVITSVADITEIEELSIYDRWGNLVFNKQHFPPNDPDASWDGRLEGKELNIGVYTYKMTVLFKDDKPETRFGDVTLIR